MMLPLVHKLWDKGVDIAATVIALVVGAIISWLWLDKAKFRQQKKLERQYEQEEKKARRRALPEEREHFAARAQGSLDIHAQDALSQDVRAWMDCGGLLGIPANLQNMRSWSAGISRFATLTWMPTPKGL